MASKFYFFDALGSMRSKGAKMNGLTRMSSVPRFVADCHTHEILKLVKLAGLEAARATDAAANPNLNANWSIVKDWSERDRYDRHSLVKAQRLHEAITHPSDGVLPWIKARW